MIGKLLPSHSKNSSIIGGASPDEHAGPNRLSPMCLKYGGEIIGSEALNYLM